jgi:hypothetical protein
MITRASFIVSQTGRMPAGSEDSSAVRSPGSHRRKDASDVRRHTTHPPVNANAAINSFALFGIEFNSTPTKPEQLAAPTWRQSRFTFLLG